MTNDTLMFDEIKALCLVCGTAIDKISKDTGISQTLVGKTFVGTMQKILEETEKRTS